MAKRRKPQPTAIPKSAAATDLPPEPVIPRPRGKLGLIFDHVAAASGATADELVVATGWQRHSVRGALSQLRARGFDLAVVTTADRKAYRLEPSRD